VAAVRGRRPGCGGHHRGRHCLPRTCRQPERCGRQGGRRGEASSHMEGHPAERRRRHPDGDVLPAGRDRQIGPARAWPLRGRVRLCPGRSGLGLCVQPLLHALSDRWPAAEICDYLRGNWWVHFLGIVGGIVWIAGSLSNFVAASAPRALQVGPAISYAIGQGSTMVGALWGVLVWREFAGGGAKVNRLLVLMFLLFVAGLGVVSVAPLYAADQIKLEGILVGDLFQPWHIIISLFGLVGLIGVLVFLSKSRKGGGDGIGPILVLRKFEVNPDPAAEFHLVIVGRAKGLVGLLLTLLRVSPESSLIVRKTDLTLDTMGLLGRNHI